VGVWRKARAHVGALLVLVTVFVVAMPPSAQASWQVPGIDVSRYQGEIRWRAVAAANIRFAVIRATLGNDYRDPRYAENLARATAHGLAVGAYHFAEPSWAPRDAIREADHFLAVARVGRDSLLPVLDIESSNGLPPAQLRAWAVAWLDRVHRRTGVRPMIYSGNSFWRGRMGNTPSFGLRSHALWVAHWNVPTPWVPGARWAGRGYTMWQWSADGRIPGIRGPVDLDRVRGGLASASIASIDVRYPGRDGTIRAPRLDCGGRRGRCSRLDNPGDRLTLRASVIRGHRFVRWTGACEAAGDRPVCTLTSYGDMTLSAVFDRKQPKAKATSTPQPAPSAPAGASSQEPTEAPSPVSTSPSVTAAPAPEPTAPSQTTTPSPTPKRGSDEDDLCGPRGCPTFPPTNEHPRHAAGRVEERDPTRFSWSRERDRRAIGGSYRWERSRSASISYGFRGGAVTLFTVEGPGMGKARVTIDGKTVAIVDGYAKRFRAGVRHRFEGLSGGRHTLTITPLGRKRRAAMGRRVVVDALRWGGHLRRDPAAASASWATEHEPAATDGEVAVSDVRGAAARIPFSGTELTLRAVRGPSAGRMRVWIDGRLVRTIDLFARHRGLATIEVADDLRDGPHVARIVVLGRGDRRNGGAVVAIDRWVVQPSDDAKDSKKVPPGQLTHGRKGRFSPSRTQP
jgi:GH25 family lysozyme M1 (1,4-beta-N-acetylmuramidase)